MSDDDDYSIERYESASLEPLIFRGITPRHESVIRDGEIQAIIAENNKGNLNFGGMSSYNNEELLSIVSHFLGPHVKKLNLCNSKINDTGAEKLADILQKFPNLTELDLSGNNIGVQGMTALTAVLPQTNITTLTLYNNKVDEESALFRRIKEALEKNRNE